MSFGGTSLPFNKHPHYFWALEVYYEAVAGGGYRAPLGVYNRRGTDRVTPLKTSGSFPAFPETSSEITPMC